MYNKELQEELIHQPEADVDTLTGKDTLRDTVGIIYENVSHDYDIELNSSSISGNIDIPLPPTKEDGLLTRKFQNYRRLIIDCKYTSPKQKVSYLTHINFSPTNVAVVTHTMEQAQGVGKECNQTYVQVTYDLAIAKIAYKIQSTSKPQFNNLFIHLGSFHLMMAFFKAIGVFINECGLSHMIIESNIIASDSVNGLVEEVIDSHSSMPIELPNNVLSRVLSAYQKFIEETRQAARQRWTKSHSIRATIISHVLDVCGLKQLQDVSADLQPNRIKIYGKQLSDFNEIFENNINPFDESLDKDSLYNIATAKPVPENVANFLLNIEKNGEDLRKQFITECAEDQNRFDKPIKKPSA
ncbi:uncharacterized protein TNCV_2745601 [Trichonephila clavipes]|nr:uncharacterized protein TNCV_2745601 [Trichonephila clavipes]